MSDVFWMLEAGRLDACEVEFVGEMVSRTPSARKPDRFLVPGFVDIHIHGAFGIDFMSATNAQMRELAGRLGECGYEAFYPTTVSAPVEQVRVALDHLPDDPRMPGFHLEGPFISPQYPGAQPPEAIVDPPPPAAESPSQGSPWGDILADPRLKVVTLAPERPDVLPMIEYLNRRGVKVSMGHTEARFSEARTGFDAGVRHATHTFNAMRPLHHREAGALGFALLEDGLAAELIYDRKHVSKEAAKLLLKCKPPEQVIAVSDSTQATGMPPGTKLTMWGLEVETRPGSVYLAGTETLAGSAITLLDAFRNLAEDFGPETAIRLCCLNPRKAMGYGAIPQTWLEFDDGYALREIHRLGDTDRSGV